MSRPDPALMAALASTRFGLGARPGELAAAAGDPQGFLAAQIRPEGGDRPEGELPDGAAALRLFAEARRRAAEARRAAAAAEAAPGPAPGTPLEPATAAAPPAAGDARLAVREARAPIRDLELAEILARARLGALTGAGFRERWTLFWANHFTVSARKPAAGALAGAFEREAVRPHVFGRFETLLAASAAHPGMLVYLDQAASVGPGSLAGRRSGRGLNENLAREILELHTVGAEGGYAQADVTEFARALTGWSVARDGEGGGFRFRPAIHEPGARLVMGRRYPEGGLEQGQAILLDLARRPATGRRLARKIAAHFVADAPPEPLVDRLEAAWRASGGDLGAVARALVTAPEAWAPEQRKFKTPNDFVLSAWRAAGAAPSAGPEAARVLAELGQRPFAAPQPNGWSDSAADWTAGSALVRRLTFASDLAARAAPPAPPLETAQAVLGAQASAPLRLALARAESGSSAFALLLMSPEFQRR